MSYAELQGSPRERFGKDGIEVVRMFRGPYNDRFTFIATLPYNCPLAGFLTATLSQIEIEPMGCPTKDPTMDLPTEANTHTEAWITITYTFDNSENSGDGAGGGGGGGGSGAGKSNTREEGGDGTFYEVETSGEIETYTAKNGGLEWVFQDPKVIPFVDPDGNGFPLRYPIQSFNLRWGKVDKPNFALLDSLLGTVNDRKVTLPVVYTEHPSETLRFDTYTTRIRYENKTLTSPKTVWELELRLQRKNVKGQTMYRARDETQESDGSSKVIGWNHFYRGGPLKTGWERVRLAGKNPYPEGDWTKLLEQLP